MQTKSAMQMAFKIFFVAVTTTLCRVAGQLLIPAGTQDVLAPSIFVANGTMPLAFTVYGVFAYGVIAALFFLIRRQMSGNRIVQGIKYGIFCSLLWCVYLLEPLPHVAAADKITYPLADTAALLVMGLLIGALCGKTKSRAVMHHAFKDIKAGLCIAGCFAAGRALQYFVFDIYSSYSDRPKETLLWVLLTGLMIGICCVWVSGYVNQKNRLTKALMIGGLLFGADYALFNFFMPLVFAADISDLLLRTVVDSTAVTIGCLFLPQLVQQR